MKILHKETEETGKIVYYRFYAEVEGLENGKPGESYEVEGTLVVNTGENVPGPSPTMDYLEVIDKDGPDLTEDEHDQLQEEAEKYAFNED